MLSGILLSFLLLLILLYGFSNIEKAFWISYVINLAIPIGVFAGSSTQKYFQINSFQISEIILVIFFILCLVNNLLTAKKLKVFFLDFIMLMLLFVIILSMVYSYGNNGNRALIDGKQYLMHIIVYFSARLSITNVDIEKFLRFTLVGSLINSSLIFCFYIYTFFIGFSGRVSFGSQSLYCITIPYIIYLLSSRVMKPKFKVSLMIGMILQSYLFLISGNRTNLIPIILGIIVGVFLSDESRINNSKNYLKLLNKKIWKLLVLIIILGSGMSYIIRNDVTLFSRYKEIIYTGIENQVSYQVRVSTKKYYKRIIKENPIDVRLGTSMPHIYLGNVTSESKEALQTDNNLLVIEYKLGVHTAIIYILVYIMGINYIFRSFNKSKNYIFLLLLFLSIFSYVGVGIMTSQILHNISIYSYYYTLLALVVKKKGGKKANKTRLDY